MATNKVAVLRMIFISFLLDDGSILDGNERIFQ